MGREKARKSAKERDNKARYSTQNKNREDARQRQMQAERRRKVAALYHAGLTQEEIADKLNCAQSTVSQDLAQLRGQWREQAVGVIGEWVARELAFAQEQRASALNEWYNGKDARMMAVVVRWTERIAHLLGLDAPSKVEDWSERDWREYALANGLNEADVIAEAEQIIAEAKVGAAIHRAGGDAAAQDRAPE